MKTDDYRYRKVDDGYVLEGGGAMVKLTGWDAKLFAASEGEASEPREEVVARWISVRRTLSLYAGAYTVEFADASRMDVIVTHVLDGIAYGFALGKRTWAMCFIEATGELVGSSVNGRIVQRASHMPSVIEEAIRRSLARMERELELYRPEPARPARTPPTRPRG